MSEIIHKLLYVLLISVLCVNSSINAISVLYLYLMLLFVLSLTTMQFG
uniref:Uncharacterized protein n=1 Tax=Arundo donax TaxID=35708 RepID=A0A0A9FFU3_ARUDO